MIDVWLTQLSTWVTEHVWIAPILAVLAGILTSITPCSLSSIPLVIGYVGGMGTEPKKAFRLSLVFAFGTAITFTILGSIAAMAGNLIGAASIWWYMILGILMLMMALQIWGIFEFIKPTYLVSKTNRQGYLGAFVAGILAGIFSSPCATPMLVALLAIVAGSANVAWGVLLLFLYSVGHGALTIVAGTSMGFVHHLQQSPKYGTFSKWVNIVFGAIMCVLGLYFFYLAF